jgi:hypothetical protein
MAATFGPACELPMWIQFLRPSATGRIEFSARLVLSSKFGILQEVHELFPKRQRVLASLAECARSQCNGLRSFDLAPDITQETLGFFLTPDMARRSSQRFAASFRVDSKQFVHPLHNRSCNWVGPAPRFSRPRKLFIRGARRR